jgi:hypothetical protein
LASKINQGETGVEQNIVLFGSLKKALISAVHGWIKIAGQ